MERKFWDYSRVPLEIQWGKSWRHSRTIGRACSRQKVGWCHRRCEWDADDAWRKFWNVLQSCPEARSIPPERKARKSESQSHFELWKSSSLSFPLETSDEHVGSTSFGNLRSSRSKLEAAIAWTYKILWLSCPSPLSRLSSSSLPRPEGKKRFRGLAGSSNRTDTRHGSATIRSPLGPTGPKPRPKKRRLSRENKLSFSRRERNSWRASRRPGLGEKNQGVNKNRSSSRSKFEVKVVDLTGRASQHLHGRVNRVHQIFYLFTTDLEIE